MIGKAVSKKDTTVAYIAPTHQQARDIAWAMLKKFAQGAASSINESRLEIILKTVDAGASQIMLRGWESIETLRGQKFDFIVIDEVASMRNWWENWHEVVRPTLTDTKGEGLFISTPKGFNHFYDLFKTPDPDYKPFHFTSFDNPLLDKEELEKARQELTEDRFAQEYLADFRKTEGLVYKEFDRFRHVYPDRQIERVTEVLVGIDFGYTNPAAILSIKRDYDNHFWVTEEWYKTRQTNEQIIQVVKRMSPHSVYPDPEAPDKIQELQNAGLNIREVNKVKDSVARGIDVVRELFKQNRLHISDQCKNLISELETYHYPDKKPEHNEAESPVKENDHALDALRYVLMTCTPYPTVYWREKERERQRVQPRIHSKTNPFH